MRRRIVCLLLAVTAIVAGPAPAAPGPPPEPKADRDARMAWWREARFGMFIHWGVYSVPAGTYDGRQIGGIGEWIMHNARIPVARYRQYASQFNPVKYDPDAWVRLAKAAGMKYLVITSKHHDGFALFGSQASDWNVVKATPYGKDLLKPLAEACARHGIKLGFYYSQAQDWNNRGGAAAGGHWDPAQDGSMDEYIDQVAIPQVREILTNYGKLAILWWDTPTDMTPERAARLFPLTKLQPGIITNNRLGGGFHGDTETPEQYIPATGYPGGRDFEVCMTMNDTWGFKSYDQNWKPVEVLVRNLIDIASKGGNYLLNVGPTSEGLIPDPSIERLRAVGRWMEANGEAIYGSSPSPFRRLPWGRCTRRDHPVTTVSLRTPTGGLRERAIGGGSTLYLHVFDWPADRRLLVPGLKGSVVKASLLADPDQPLETQPSDQGLVVGVPAMAPDSISSTVALELGAGWSVEPWRFTQNADGTATLPAAEATLHGEQIRYEQGDKRDNIGFWLDPKEWVEWPLRIVRPGRYVVVATVAAPSESPFEIRIGGRTLKTKAPKTGDYGNFQAFEVGTVELAAGATSVEVRPITEGWSAINLKSVELKPAN